MGCRAAAWMVGSGGRVIFSSKAPISRRPGALACPLEGRTSKLFLKLIVGFAGENWQKRQSPLRTVIAPEADELSGRKKRMSACCHFSQFHLLLLRL